MIITRNYLVQRAGWVAELLTAQVRMMVVQSHYSLSSLSCSSAQLIWFVKFVSCLQSLPDNFYNFCLGAGSKKVPYHGTKDKYLYNFHKNIQPGLLMARR